MLVSQGACGLSDMGTESKGQPPTSHLKQSSKKETFAVCPPLPVLCLGFLAWEMSIVLDDAKSFH